MNEVTSARLIRPIRLLFFWSEPSLYLYHTNRASLAREALAYVCTFGNLE